MAHETGDTYISETMTNRIKIQTVNLKVYDQVQA